MTVKQIIQLLLNKENWGTHCVQVVYEEQVWQSSMALQLLLEQIPWFSEYPEEQLEQTLSLLQELQFAILQGIHPPLSKVNCGRHCEQILFAEQVWQKLTKHSKHVDFEIQDVKLG